MATDILPAGCKVQWYTQTQHWCFGTTTGRHWLRRGVLHLEVETIPHKGKYSAPLEAGLLWQPAFLLTRCAEDRRTA